MVIEERVGITFEPEDADDLCRALSALAVDPDALQALRSNDPSAAAKYDRCVLAGNMLRRLERLANVRTSA